MTAFINLGPKTLANAPCWYCKTDTLHVKGVCRDCGRVEKPAKWRKVDFCRDRPAGVWRAKR